MLGIKKIAAAAISNTSFGYDKRYKYTVPIELEGKVYLGARVLVPFGKGNRKRIALVIRLEDAGSQDISGFKPIHSVIDDEPLIDAEMLDLVMWMRETTLCTYFEAFKTIIPLGLNINYTRKYEAVSKNIPDISLLSSEVVSVWNEILEDSTTIENTPEKYISELADKGFLREVDSLKRRKKDELVKMVKLSEAYAGGELTAALTAKQKAVTGLLEEYGTASVKEAAYICGVTPQVIKNMVSKGVLEEYEYEIIRIPEVSKDSDINSIVLSEQQSEAYNGICRWIDIDTPVAALLHGVTGSGKTPVFAKLINYTLEQGKTVIMLIPEISLTPQTVERFQSLFGDLVSVMHSSLSLTQRLNEYKRVKNGQAKIVVGTRSAVFAPLKNIGLIIIDEEGERTYKSESSPRYNAKDIAKKRCVTHNAVLLLASATPSVESYYNAVTGRYKLFEMNKRYAQDVLPDVEIVDLVTDGFYGESTIFSGRLTEEININLERGEQTILLLNRRGYHTFISCGDCKTVLKCPQCCIPLTYHKVNGRLLCHYCGFSKEAVNNCPECGQSRLNFLGAGTQKVEDEISSLFPSARVLRMDADTTYSRYAYEKNFKAFERGEYDIMLGTQMIAKGLDFPGVTLVGVLTIDKSLFTGDFRSYERTFSLVTQVVGRCGRGEKQGRALIQTYMPEHYVINLSAMQDYIGFYEQEISMRKALTFPPFCDTCTIEFASVMDKRADLASMEFLRLIQDKIEKEHLEIPLRVIGPAKCIYEKINGKYRYRIIIKCKNNSEFRAFISEIYKRSFSKKEFSNVSVYLDINGDLSL